MTLEEARALFPVLEAVAYLNAGTFGPLAEPVARAQQEALARDLAHGRSGLPYFEEAMALRAELRAQFASLVGAEVDQVALTGSTTDGCGIVLRGLGLEPGDEIVTTTDEHFGLLGPLAASGADVVVVAPQPDAILAAVTPRTKLIATSQVLWTTGAVLPLAESSSTGHALGTRHRAALGITEQTDAVVVIVSEETGIISIAHNGRMVRNLDEGKLRKVLGILYKPAGQHRGGGPLGPITGLPGRLAVWLSGRRGKAASAPSA